jgi:general secretion pathway protein N
MLAIFQRQPVIAVLAIAAALLVVAIGLETGFGARLGPVIPAGVSKPAAPFEAKLLPALAATDPERSYPETAARPLFVPQRRPAPPAEPAQQANLKRGLYTLQGVTIAGDTRIALLKEKSTGHIVRAEKGKDLNGMKIAEVTPESVTLALGSEQEVIPLQVMKPGPSPTTPPGGPFGAAGTASALPPVPQPPGAPGTPNPAPQQGGASFGPTPHTANPVAAPVPQATTAPMSPEELLARRRARRAQ